LGKGKIERSSNKVESDQRNVIEFGCIVFIGDEGRIERLTEGLRWIASTRETQ
jgi:hypothetical protein